MCGPNRAKNKRQLLAKGTVGQMDSWARVSECIVGEERQVRGVVKGEKVIESFLHYT